MILRAARSSPCRALRKTIVPSRCERGQRCISNDSRFLKISGEVREALYAKKPVVALETTIYTHGYPYPENVALASELESIVRVNGGVPATIGIIDGVAKVGLSPEELIELAASAGKENTLKLSRRDLSYVLGTRLVGKRFHGGTTIAGTMILAHLAGIKVFATGGLGGVHRGAESSMDISADLTELGRTSVAVISSGCKSFLDIPRTLEYLETEGVTVGTFADGRPGKVDFPAFWSRDSGVCSPLTITDEKEAASIIYAHLNLPLSSGLHFANPVPEESSIPKADMDVFIEEAIRQADASGATGKDNTPFILSKIKELSKGKSLGANRALICANVKRGTLVAKELAALENEMEGHQDMLSAFTRPIPSAIENIIASQQQHTSLTAQPRSVEPAYSTKAIDAQRKAADIVVAGALACDYSCDFAPLEESLTNPQQQTSNPATIRQSLGGVAHNVAKAAHYIGGNVKLISLVGNDLDGNSARDQLASEGMRTDGVEVCKLEDARTARYVAVNDAKKDLVVAMADMNLLNTHGPEYMQNQWKKELQEQSPNYFVADANWEPHLLLSWFKTAKAAGSYTAYEPVSVAKGSRLFTPVRVAAKTPLELTSSKQKELGIFPSHDINLMAPNAMELAAIHSLARDSGVLDKESWWAVINEMNIPSSGIRSQLVHVTSPEIVDQGIPQQAIQLLPFVPCIITKLGSEGVLLAMLLQDGNSLLRSPEAAPYIISRNLEDVKHHDVGGLYMRHYPPVSKLEESQIVSVNGVGDTFLGALISAMNATGRGVEELVDFAQRAAVLTLQSPEAVSTRLRELSIDDEL